MANWNDSVIQMRGYLATIAGGVLPSGAATSAKQDTGNASLSSIDGKLATLAIMSADLGTVQTDLATVKADIALMKADLAAILAILES
jgi:hypothetical protein